MKRIEMSALVLLVLLGLHIADHAFNQPSRTVPELSGIVGGLGFAVVAAVFIAARFRSASAAPMAALAGIGTVAGFIVVHLLGNWTPVSDPYWDFDANLLSWLALIAPMVAGAALAQAGLAMHPMASGGGTADGGAAPIRARRSGGAQ